MYQLTRQQKIENLQEEIKVLQQKKENIEKEIQKRKNALDRQRNLAAEEATRESNLSKASSSGSFDSASSLMSGGK